MAQIATIHTDSLPAEVYIHRDGNYYDQNEDGSIVVKVKPGKKSSATILVAFIEGTWIEPIKDKADKDHGKQSRALFALLEAIPIAKVMSKELNDHVLVLEVILDPDNASTEAKTEAKRAAKEQRDKHNSLEVTRNSGDSGSSNGSDDGDSDSGSDDDNSGSDNSGDSGSGNNNSGNSGSGSTPPPPRKRADDEDLLGRKHAPGDAISRDEADDIIRDTYRQMGYSDDEIRAMLGE